MTIKFMYIYVPIEIHLDKNILTEMAIEMYTIKLDTGIDTFQENK